MLRVGRYGKLGSISIVSAGMGGQVIGRQSVVGWASKWVVGGGRRIMVTSLYLEDNSPRR